jgi:multidrug resistance protein
MRVGDRPTNLGLHALHSGSTLDIETQQDEGPELHHLGIRRTPSKTTIFFRPSGPEHPNNWSLVRALPRGQFLQPEVSAEWKSVVIMGGIMSVINSALASYLPGGGISEMARYFKISSEAQLVLPISVLFGYVGGPVLCGPLSENYGRKPVMIISFLIYIAFTRGYTLAPTWPVLLVLRWVCGVMASAPIAVVGGLYADIFGDARKRGVAMAVFMGATTFGPVLGPLASGFIATASWRWCFWLGLILAGVTLPFLFIMPETYVPVLISRKAANLRAETGNSMIVANSELEKKTARYILTIVMTRPFRMLIHESIVMLTCMYLRLVYAIFYLSIFRGISDRFPRAEFHLPLQCGHYRPDLPTNRHWRRVMHLYIHLVRFLSCQGSEAECSLGSHRGVPPLTVRMHWRSPLCNRTFLDRLVCQVRGALDCANSQRHSLWHGFPPHIHGVSFCLSFKSSLIAACSALPEFPAP